MDQFLFLIPLVPLLGFLFNFTYGVKVLGRPSKHGEGVHGHHGPSPLIGYVACGAVAVSFLLSAAAVLQARQAPEHTLIQTLWTWIPGGAAETLIGGTPGAAPFQVDWAYQVDPLSSVMILVVTFVGFLIHVYSTGYMSHDAGYARYMSYLNLFMFAMLTLVLGANYAVLFVGWEGVGLCSYLLIGFWFTKQSAADAGKKAFIVNRIGDAGFVLGMFLIWMTVGSVDFRSVAAAVAQLPVETSWTGTLTMAALFLFVGACGKSAQLPLYVWLPDAMEGPTPVSALIHAATMVTAGVYMVARSSAIYAHAPNAMLVVALVGAMTAIFAASIGLAQYDIKRVLAYSTVSQLGYMFLACGVGAFTAAVFHLATHAFFKALLFLGSGSVIHGMSGEQDMRKMGGLKSKLPVTHLTMLIGCIAIAGIPPLAGFFSKDEILWSAFKIGGYGQLVWGIGVVTAAMTAFYMFRLYHMTFSGSFRGTHEQEHHVHESPKSMTIPAPGAGGRLGDRRLRGDPARDRLPARRQPHRALARARVRGRQPHAGGDDPGASRPRHGPRARVDGGERGDRGREHPRRVRPLQEGRRGCRRAARGQPGRTAPAAAQQVLRGRDLRRAVRARAGARRRRGSLVVRPPRHRRRRRQGASGLAAQRERHRVAVPRRGREAVGLVGPLDRRRHPVQAHRQRLRELQLCLPRAAERPGPALRADDADPRAVHGRHRKPVHPVGANGWICSRGICFR
jgi:NADH-quinone oxidoreductase subunit L